MGMDGIDLLITIEENFGIEIKNEDASSIETVGQLYECICQKCRAQIKNSYAIKKAFYQLREILSKSFKISKDQIRPKTKIHDIANTIKKKHLWDCIKEKTSFRLPNLILPRWLFHLLLIIGFLSGPLISYLIIIVFFKSNSNILRYESFYILVPFFWILLGIIIPRLISPLQTVIPKKCLTVGNLTQQIVELNAKHFEPLSKQEVWRILVKIISEQGVLEIEKFTPETHFREIFPGDYY